MPNNNQYPQRREVIVDKLNGALANFRRERDEVHRSKELALERLRLIREERILAERNVHLMQEKYEQMIKSISSHTNGKDDEIAKLQVEVERLSRETRFQHGELVSKREKLNKLESSMAEEEKKMTSYIRLAREALRKRREKVAILDAKDDSKNREEAEDVDAIVSLLRNSGDDLDVYTKLQRLIEKNASDLEDEVNSIQHNANLARKRIIGYTQLLNTNEENAKITGQ